MTSKPMILRFSLFARMTGVAVLMVAGLMPGCSSAGDAEKSETAGSSISFSPALAGMDNPSIRVRLVHTVSEITVVPQGAAWEAGALTGGGAATLQPGSATKIQRTKQGMIAVDAGGGKQVVMPAVALRSAAPGATLEIKDVPYGVGWSWENKESRAYEGTFEIYPLENGNLEVILEIALEEYLLGVVPSEIGATSPQEALRAQAVAARSEALLALINRKYAGAHHDIGSDVESQAYSGNAKRAPQSDESVRATRGLAMFFDGQPLAAYYASSCGGHSDDIRNVWPNRAGEKGYWDTAAVDGPDKSKPDLTTDAGVRSWLTANPDVFCNPERYNIPEWARKNFRWEREFTADELTAFVSKQKDIGRVTGIRAIKRGPSGRMIEAEFVGEKGTFRTGPELAIRRVFDPPLRGAGFVVDVVGPDGVAVPAEAPAAGGSPAPPAKPEKFILRGAGWGHGVGMCQTGAIARANAGQNFRTILKHYYPKAEIKAVYK